MTSPQNESQALGDLAARQLANATKTVPQLSTITPRWLLHLLSWVPVEAGIYRVNRVVNPEQVAVRAEPGAGTDERLPETYVDYETSPREYTLRTISTLLDIHTRVSDLYCSPHDQMAQQLRLTIETIKERQESELVNSPEYGLLAQATPEQTIQTLGGAPTPDDLDALITRVWKTPSFFLTHPLGVAAFGREATYRGVPPVVVSLFGAQFITWRGIPLVPSDKVPVEDGKTKVILVRTGEERQGVVGLFQPGLVGEQAPGLSVRFTGINQSAIATYLVTLYTSRAVLTDDALALLDAVAGDQFMPPGVADLTAFAVPTSGIVPTVPGVLAGSAPTVPVAPRGSAPGWLPEAPSVVDLGWSGAPYAAPVAPISEEPSYSFLAQPEPVPRLPD